ncbi:MAG: arginine deiminase [Bacteroidetes bacterium GWA2_31_9]|nr:MAG: arginine deiminase [Bacteroidetes bacterium GWA2_31_9]
MNQKIELNSEIGKLEAVIIHTPGKEVENMTPTNVEKALYSDILNLSVISEEYLQFKGVLDKVTKTYEVHDLLFKIICNNKVKENLINKICCNEGVPQIIDFLLRQTNEALAKQLLEGVVMKKNHLTNYLSKDKYILQPLHNFFFTRDAAIAFKNEIFIGRMSNKIRDRESFIMKAIFDYHPQFSGNVVSPYKSKHFHENLTIEGGDFLVMRDNLIIIGLSNRTSSHGIDFILKTLKDNNEHCYIIVQELPGFPESFIHLDMVFTLVDYGKCVIYEPVILNSKYQTLLIETENKKVKPIKEFDNILTALHSIGIEMESISCGGSDAYNQEREQWHSGANFVAIEPGKIIGYDRNIHTIEALNNAGFEVISSNDIVNESKKLEEYKKCVITVPGAELSRGGGGCRCMTMPIKREKLS